jgi:hypothetical protein
VWVAKSGDVSASEQRGMIVQHSQEQRRLRQSSSVQLSWGRDDSLLLDLELLQPIRIIRMPILGIIDDIDAYLSRLRTARKILLGHGNGAPHMSKPGRKERVSVDRAKNAVSSKRAHDRSASPPDRAVADVMPADEAVEISAQLFRACPPISRADLKATVKAERTEPATPHGPVIKRIPARRRTTQIRAVRRRTGKPDNSGTMMPAIALTRPKSNNVVVVLAQQLKREREQTAQPARMTSRPPASSQSARSAFEALFKDRIPEH